MGTENWWFYYCCQSNIHTRQTATKWSLPNSGQSCFISFFCRSVPLCSLHSLTWPVSSNTQWPPPPNCDWIVLSSLNWSIIMASRCIDLETYFLISSQGQSFLTTPQSLGYTYTDGLSYTYPCLLDFTNPACCWMWTLHSLIFPAPLSFSPPSLIFPATGIHMSAALPLTSTPPLTTRPFPALHIGFPSFPGLSLRPALPHLPIVPHRPRRPSFSPPLPHFPRHSFISPGFTHFPRSLSSFPHSLIFFPPPSFSLPLPHFPRPPSSSPPSFTVIPPSSSSPSFTMTFPALPHYPGPHWVFPVFPHPSFPVALHTFLVLFSLLPSPSLSLLTPPPPPPPPPPTPPSPSLSIPAFPLYPSLFHPIPLLPVSNSSPPPPPPPKKKKKKKTHRLGLGDVASGYRRQIVGSFLKLRRLAASSQRQAGPPGVRPRSPLTPHAPPELSGRGDGERAGERGVRGDRGEVGVDESREQERWRRRGDLSGSGNSLVFKQDGYR